MDFSTGGSLIMSQPNGLLILGDHLFLNHIFFFGQRGLINTAGFINPNLTFYIYIYNTCMYIYTYYTLYIIHVCIYIYIYIYT